MNQKRGSLHRRKWKRFTVKDGALVILEKPRIMGFLGQTRVEFGPIVNLSMGGLASQYIENKKRMKPYPQISIVIPGGKKIIERIAYEIIADFQIAEMPDGKIIRNRCVKFQHMTSFHTFQLDDYIREFSTSYIMDRRSGEERRKFEDQRYEDPEWKTRKERRSGKDRRAYPIIIS